MSEATMTSRRPTTITVLCILGFVGLPIAIGLAFTPFAQEVGDWYPPFLIACSLLGLVMWLGIWRMKRWAAWSYTGLAAFCQVTLLIAGIWNVGALVLPALVVFFLMRNLSLMS